MNNTVDALKNLYKTLTGQDYSGDPNPTDAEMIDAIAKDASDGGSGGGEPLIVTSTTEDDITTLGSTWQEIANAYKAGRVVMVEQTAGEFSSYYSVVGVSNDPSQPWLDVAVMSAVPNMPIMFFSTTSADDYPYYMSL